MELKVAFDIREKHLMEEGGKMSARLARPQVIQSTVYVLLRITDPLPMLGPPPSVLPLHPFVRQSVSVCPSVY